MGLGFNESLQKRAKSSVITPAQGQSHHLRTPVGNRTVKGLFQCSVALTLLLYE